MTDTIHPLERLATEAVVLAGGDHPCHILGHRWKFIGAKACNCDLGDGYFGECSVPVHECESCPDCDYGDNAEADEIIEMCRRERLS